MSDNTEAIDYKRRRLRYSIWKWDNYRRFEARKVVFKCFYKPLQESLKVLEKRRILQVSNLLTYATLRKSKGQKQKQHTE